MMKNLNNVPSGEVLMHNSFLNRRLTKIQKEEPHVIDTSMETIYLLRLIVSNANAMLSGGVNNIFDEIYVGFTNTNSANQRFYEAGAPRDWFCSLNLGYRF